MDQETRIFYVIFYYKQTKLTNTKIPEQTKQPFRWKGQDHNS